jgi:hypothetical protein
MEDIIVPLIVFSFIALIVKMSLDYSKWKKMHQSGTVEVSGREEGNSLPASELRNLILEAVETANEPLLQRIERLEESLVAERPRLEKGDDVRQLGAPADLPKS